MHADLNARIAAQKARDEAFFTAAFTDPVTGVPNDVPADIKRLSTRLCSSYSIRGLCDPMYIANIIALELGLGDGQGNFKPELIPGRNEHGHSLATV